MSILPDPNAAAEHRQANTIDAHGTAGVDAHNSGTSSGFPAALTLGALGVVYGDIGTSPIYSLRECFHLAHLEATPTNVLGLLSLVFWSLALTVTLKYVTFVLRADNDGEGGILALTSLLVPLRARLVRRRLLYVVLGLIGSALLYGDSIITPAISVLSATEGLEQIAPATKPWVIPLTLIILVGLFAFQYKGTAGVGKIFGPVMVVWFSMLAALGIYHFVQHPGVIEAVNPVHAVDFFRANGFVGFTVLGSVFLCVTGGEALYADLGHFGRKPIQYAWLGFVLPSLLLCYFGQGALLLSSPEAQASMHDFHPFFQMAPAWFLPFQVVLACVATVIASQAVISGAFSLTMQLVQFGYLPRLKIVNTSEHHAGQVYLPFVNGALLVGCVALVLTFRSSSALAAAYGIAVTSTMGITTVLFTVLARRRWKWSWALALGFLLVFIPIDLAFFGANALKIMHGGWVPIVIALGLFVIMMTWKKGRTLVQDAQHEGRLPVEMFISDLASRDVPRVKGTAVFFNPVRHVTPSSLLHNFKHNQVLHSRNLFVDVETMSRPFVPKENRFEIEDLGADCYQVVMHYGFAEQPTVAEDLIGLEMPGGPVKMMSTTFFMRRERIVTTGRGGMMRWRKQAFATMQHASADVADYFGLPVGRVIELGERVVI